LGLSAVERKSQGGHRVFNFVAGFILAIVFFGVPLGIIGLFVASILDRRAASLDQASKTSPKVATAGFEVKGDRNRRVVIYGRQSTVTTAADDRSKLKRTAELQGR
jgi:hypothetical protein